MDYTKFRSFVFLLPYKVFFYLPVNFIKTFLRGCISQVLSRSTSEAEKTRCLGDGFRSKGVSISSITIAAAFIPISFAGISIEVIDVRNIPPTT